MLMKILSGSRSELAKGGMIGASWLASLFVCYAFFFATAFLAAQHRSVFDVQADPAADTTVHLAYQDTVLILPDYPVVMPVIMSVGEEISAISIGLIFPEEFLRIDSMDLADGVKGYNYNVKDSLFTLAWSNVTPLVLNDGDTLLRLFMRTYDLAGLSGSIRIALTAGSEFADGAANIIPDVRLQSPELYYKLPDPNDTTGNGYLKIFPNPFEDQSRIEFYLEAASSVRISLCNMLGETVAPLIDGHYDKGMHYVPLSAVNYAKGAYLLRFSSDDGLDKKVMTRKILVY
jgi:hypothetical protein